MKRHIQSDLIEHLKYFFHVHVLIIVSKPVRKGCYRLVNFISSCVLVRHLGSRFGGASRCGVRSRINVSGIFLLVDLVIHLLF